MGKIIEFDGGFSIKQHRARIAELRVGQIVRPSDVRQEVDADMDRGRGPHGARWPWRKCREDFALSEGGISVLASDGGVGKSTLVSQWALSLMSDHPVGIISIEEGTVKVVRRLISQFCHTLEPSRSQRDEYWGAAAHSNALIYDCPQAITPVDAYAACWAMFDEGARVIFLDNMQSCGCKTDSDEERDFINEVKAICQATKMHIVLVHHVRKTGGDSENPKPTRDRVKGNGAITQLVDNVLLLWRNRDRQAARRHEDYGHPVSEEQRRLLNDFPDLELTVSKQRDGEDHWVLALWDGNGLTFKDERYGDDLKLGRISEI